MNSYVFSRHLVNLQNTNKPSKPSETLSPPTVDKLKDKIVNILLIHATEFTVSSFALSKTISFLSKPKKRLFKKLHFFLFAEPNITLKWINIIKNLIQIF